MIVILQYEINGETYIQPGNISQDGLLTILQVMEDERV